MSFDLGGWCIVSTHLQALLLDLARRQLALQQTFRRISQLLLSEFLLKLRELRYDASNATKN